MSSTIPVQLKAGEKAAVSSGPDTDNGNISFSAAIASLISWINEINCKIVDTWAKAASHLAVINQKIAQDQTDELHAAMNVPWESKYDNKGVDSAPESYQPGINNIPHGDTYAQQWQGRAQNYYQQLQLRTQANITTSNTVAQNASDNASDGSKTTQGDYNIMGQITQVVSGIRQDLPS